MAASERRDETRDGGLSNSSQSGKDKKPRLKSLIAQRK